MTQSSSRPPYLTQGECARMEDHADALRALQATADANDLATMRALVFASSKHLDRAAWAGLRNFLALAR